MERTYLEFHRIKKLLRTDKSDEIACEMISSDASYLRDVSPAPDNDDQLLTNVNISVDVLSILDINEV